MEAHLTGKRASEEVTNSWSARLPGNWKTSTVYGGATRRKLRGRKVEGTLTGRGGRKASELLHTLASEPLPENLRRWREGHFPPKSGSAGAPSVVGVGGVPWPEPENRKATETRDYKNCDTGGSPKDQWPRNLVRKALPGPDGPGRTIWTSGKAPAPAPECAPSLASSESMGVVGVGRHVLGNETLSAGLRGTRPQAGGSLGEKTPALRIDCSSRKHRIGPQRG